MAAVLALLSSLLWGTADYIAGRLSRLQSVLVVVAVTQAVGLVTMLLIAVISGSSPSPIDYLPWAVLASLAGAGGLALYYQALAIGTMGVVSPIASLGVCVPLAVGIASGERPSSAATIGIVVALVGVVLASGPEVRGAAGWPPVALAAAAAMLLGTALVGIARGSEIDLVMTMTAMRFSTVAVLTGLLLIRHRPGRRTHAALASGVPASRSGEPGGDIGYARRALAIVRANPSGYLLVGLFDVGANLAFGAASRLGMLAIVSVFGSLYPVATILLAWRCDGERLRMVQYLGIAAALAGAAAISRG